MRKFALGFLSFLLLACNREPAAPHNPAFNFMNNPDNGNPMIARYGDSFGLVVVDQTRGLFSLQAATDRQFGCQTPSTSFTVLDVQDLLHNPFDPAAGQINEIVQGKSVYIAVYRDWDAWAASGFDCADLFARKIAEGTGRMIYTDNDLLSFLRPNTNSNAFGVMAQGVVQFLGGGAGNYQGHERCVWDGEDQATVRCQDQIALQ